MTPEQRQTLESCTYLHLSSALADAKTALMSFDGQWKGSLTTPAGLKVMDRHRLQTIVEVLAQMVERIPVEEVTKK